MNRGVFLDTVGLLAVWNRSDQWHEAASAALSRFDPESSRSITTSLVLLECGNAAARRTFRQDVDELRVALEDGNRVVFPTLDDWNTAWASYRKGENAQAGIVDQVSFVVMRRLGIERAFTNDRHFAAAGFEVLF